MSPANRTQIIIALIGALGILGGALIANWDKVFRSAPSGPPTVGTGIPSNQTGEKSKFVVTVYFPPEREKEGKLLAKTLGNEGYIINTLEWSSPESNQSYIYFGKPAVEEVVKVRNMATDFLEEEFGVYPDDTTPDAHSILIVLINKS